MYFKLFQTDLILINTTMHRLSYQLQEMQETDELLLEKLEWKRQIYKEGEASYDK
jgi:hypothetical protein